MQDILFNEMIYYCDFAATCAIGLINKHYYSIIYANEAIWRRFFADIPTVNILAPQYHRRAIAIENKIYKMICEIDERPYVIYLDDVDDLRKLQIYDVLAMTNHHTLISKNNWMRAVRRLIATTNGVDEWSDGQFVVNAMTLLGNFVYCVDWDELQKIMRLIEH